MHLLVTRPEPDAAELIKHLERAGHEVAHVPLLEIKFYDEVTLPETKPQAVLVTSANGARGLGRLKQMADLETTLAVTVGAASAEAAQKAGFKNITRTERGDVIGVINFVRQHLKPGDGPLLYVSGEKTSGDLVAELRSSGFAVDNLVLYKAERATRLPLSVCEVASQGLLDGVLLFSPRTAKIWLSLADSQSGGCISPDEMAKIKHYCLSENVAKIIDQGLGKFSDTIICKEPDTPSMLQAVSGAY